MYTTFRVLNVGALKHRRLAYTTRMSSRPTHRSSVGAEGIGNSIMDNTHDLNDFLKFAGWQFAPRKAYRIRLVSEARVSAALHLATNEAAACVTTTQVGGNLGDKSYA